MRIFPALFATFIVVTGTLRAQPVTLPCGVPGVTATYETTVCQSQSAAVTLNNGSGQTLVIHGSNPVIMWATPDCSPPSLPSYSQGVDYTIPPGTSKAVTWSGNTAALSPGSYSMTVVYSVGLVQHSCCLPVAITPGFVIYGNAGKGTGGKQPVFAANGFGLGPTIGNSQYLLFAFDVVGGASGVLMVGSAAASIAFPWGELLVNPAQPFVVTPVLFSGTPGIAGGGDWSAPAPIPNVPSLVGATVFLQLLIQDPGSAGGVVHSRGLQITLCD